jgi:hypothetical protein
LRQRDLSVFPFTVPFSAALIAGIPSVDFMLM